MANKDRARGFEPHGSLLRQEPYVAGAEVFPGDAVVLSDDGKVDPATSAASPILGVALTYAAADGDEVMVADHPDQQLIVQADGSDIDAQTDIGNNALILSTAGDSTYRVSRQELDSSTLSAVATTSGSYPLRVMRVDARPDNEAGAQVDVVVAINNHQLGQSRDGI